MFERYVLIL